MADFFGPVVSPGILQALIASFQGRRDRAQRQQQINLQEESVQSGNILMRSLLSGLAQAPGQALGSLPGQLISNANQREMQASGQQFQAAENEKERNFQRGPLMNMTPPGTPMVPPMMGFARDIGMMNQAMAPQRAAAEAEKSRAQQIKLASMPQKAPSTPAADPANVQRYMDARRGAPPSIMGEQTSPHLPLLNESEVKLAMAEMGAETKEDIAAGVSKDRQDKLDIERERLEHQKAADVIKLEIQKQMADLSEIRLRIESRTHSADDLRKYEAGLIKIAQGRFDYSSKLDAAFKTPTEKEAALREFDSLMPKTTPGQKFDVNEEKINKGKADLLQRGNAIKAMPEGPARQQAWLEWKQLAKTLGIRVE